MRMLSLVLDAVSYKHYCYYQEGMMFAAYCLCNDCGKKNTHTASHYSRFTHFFSVTHLKRQQAAAAATTKRENKKIADD